jgi:acetyl esterase
VISRIERAAVRAVLSAPSPILRALAGGRIRRDGQVLDQQLAALLAVSRRLGVDRIAGRPPAEARAHAARAGALLDCDPRPMAQVIDTHAPGPAGAIPVRVYRPRAATGAMIVYFHGGGGVIGSIAAYDPLCRFIADETRAVVASVEYRLAPEHPHPAAVDDAVAAFRWARGAAVSLGVAPDRIALAGDSMGGYLSAMVERRERSAPRPAALLLIYPLVDLTLSSPSIDTFADGFLLTRELMHWFRGLYCPDPAAQRAGSPLLLPEADVQNVAPTIVATAGFDPLRDEGRAWAARLRGAASLREHPSLIHGFATMTGAVRAAQSAMLGLCAELATMLEA